MIEGLEAVFSEHLLEARHYNRRRVKDDEDIVIPKSLGQLPCAWVHSPQSETYIPDLL